VALASVLIDSREPEWVRRLTFGGVPTAVTALEAGDFLCACDDAQMIGIERKEATDLLNSLRDRRLLPQLSRLRAQCEWAYLMICGELRCSDGMVVTPARVTEWQWASLQGALLDVQEMGVNVVYVPTNAGTDLEDAIARLARRDRNLKRIPPARSTHILSDGEACIAALPGIGLDRAFAVLEATDRPFWALIALASANGHDHIPGIGPGIRAKIRKELGFTDKYANLEFAVLPIGCEAKEL
jgi:ERCC4-type nuclease